MKTCLFRAEYNAEIAQRLLTVFSPADTQKILDFQLAKNSTQARLECLHRGANVVDLPGDQSYDPQQIDAIVQAADLCGWLSVEAQLARSHNQTLAEYRRGLEG